MASTTNSRRRKVLTLVERVKAIDLMGNGEPAYATVLFLGIGKIQILGILAKKILMMRSSKAGMNGKLQYLAAKQSKNAHLSQRELKPASAGVLRQLGIILLDSVLFLLFSFTSCSPCLLCHGCVDMRIKWLK